MNTIEIINFHLWEDKNSFLSKLYESREFDFNKFLELIKAIKELNKKWDLYSVIKNEYENCVWNSFLSNIIWKLYIILSIEGDIREYKEKINIDLITYSSYIEELIYELQSLFSNKKWNKDYHWNKY